MRSYEGTALNIARSITFLLMTDSDEEGVHNQDIYEIAYEMIAEARAAREADQ